MKYVYLLESRMSFGRRYVGSTDDLTARLTEHNDGRFRATNKHLPWRCVVAMWFQDDFRADAFERYLKTAAGRLFAKRHFW